MYVSLEAVGNLMVVCVVFVYSTVLVLMAGGLPVWVAWTCCEWHSAGLGLRRA